MRRRHRAKLAALFGVLAALGPRPVLAADRACSAMALEAEPSLSRRYPDLLPRVRDELAAFDDLDPCAHIELSLRDGAAIGVYVTLPDGRSASRTAALREDVVPTLQALLLVPTLATAPVANNPPASSTVPPRPPASQRAAASARRRVLPARSERDAPELLPTVEPRSLGIELSVVSGARVGDGQTSFGLGALSFLEISGWLIGGQLRADSYQTLAGDSQETALELAALFGRRLHFQGIALDFSLGPAIAEKGIAVSDAEVMRVDMNSTSSPLPPPEGTSGAVPRLIFGSRLGFSPRSVFRTFIGIDGELGPARAEETTDSRAPGLPTWTVGLALGATVGTR